VEHFESSSRNIRPGWKGLPGTNNLAYLVSSPVTMTKTF
jgi:hypothetical protein